MLATRGTRMWENVSCFPSESPGKGEQGDGAEQHWGEDYEMNTDGVSLLWSHSDLDGPRRLHGERQKSGHFHGSVAGTGQ